MNIVKLIMEEYHIDMSRTKDKILTFIFILIIGVIITLVFGYIGKNPSKNTCTIGIDSQDCLEGAGSGHPLWNY